MFPAPMMPPWPSNVWVPTSAYGPATEGGATSDPTDVYANVPYRLAAEHPLSDACALAAAPNTIAAAAASVQVLPKRFFTSIDLTFIRVSIPEGGKLEGCFSFRRYGRNRTAVPATLILFFCATPWRSGHRL